MSRVLFVTAAYGLLWDTMFGGRSGRREHYGESLISLSKLGADFVVYTSNQDEQDYYSDYIRDRADSSSNFRFVQYDLAQYRHHSAILNIQGGFNNLLKDRCFQLQYCKFQWLQQSLDDRYTDTYWIDAGLSHTGLFPSKYKCGDNGYRDQYQFSIFDRQLLNGLVATTDHRITILLNTNRESPLVDSRYLTRQPSTTFHVVGGLFGGKTNNIQQLCHSFDQLADQTIANQHLYTEEQIMTALVINQPDNFNPRSFDTWYHEDSIRQMAPHINPDSVTSFCQMFEAIRQTA